MASLRKQRGWWQLAAAAVGALSDVYSANQASSGAAKANKMNLQIAREQMGFQERMSSTAYQRAVMDLKAAGINPMMAALNGGASSPPGAAAHMENEEAESSRILSNMVPKAVQNAIGVSTARQAAAQVDKTKADTRLTNAEAAIREASVPYSAESALQAMRKLTAETNAAIHQVEIKRIERLSDSEVYHELQPVLIQYQKYVTEMARLGIPEAKAQADFWAMLENAGGSLKAMKFIREMAGGLMFKGGNTYNPTTIIRR